MRWNYWVINTANKDVAVPESWHNVLKIIKNLVDNKIIDKIEVAAFTIRGMRTLRWLIPPEHHEYSTEEDCIEVAKKLLAAYLETKDVGIEIPDDLQLYLSDYLQYANTKCSLCLDELEKHLFFLDGRTEPNAIAMGHIEPLNQRSEYQHNHFATNTTWQHRRCNYMQGERNINTALNYMLEILHRHGKI